MLCDVGTFKIFRVFIMKHVRVFPYYGLIMSPIFACQMIQFTLQILLYRASLFFVLGGLIGLSVFGSIWVFILSTKDSDTSSAIPCMLPVSTVSSSSDKFASI